MGEMTRSEAVFTARFIDDFRWWIRTDRRTSLRLLRLVEAALRDPFSGAGKPERLRHALPDTWSRRLTQEHRLVYRVGQGRLIFLQARYHY